MLHNLDWQSLHKRRQDQRLVLFYKIINGLTSVYTMVYCYQPTVIQEQNCEKLIIVGFVMLTIFSPILNTIYDYMIVLHLLFSVSSCGSWDGTFRDHSYCQGNPKHCYCSHTNWSTGNILNIDPINTELFANGDDGMDDALE